MKYLKILSLSLSVLFMSGCTVDELLKELNMKHPPKVNLIEAIDSGKVGGFDRNDPINVQYEVLLNYVRSMDIQCIDDNMKSGPSPEISNNSKLVDAAKEHSDDMLNTGNFSHEGSDGSHSYDRMRKHGFKGLKYAENIYREHDSLGNGKDAWIHAIESWITSTDGHCSNMMDPDITDFGMYESKNSNNTTSYITLDLGQKE